MNKQIDLNVFNSFFVDNTHYSEIDGFKIARDEKYNTGDGDTLIRNLIKDVNLSLSLLPSTIGKYNIKAFFAKHPSSSSVVLSCLFQLVDPSWTVVRGICKTNNKIEHCYLQKDDIILDLELKVISIAKVYGKLFRPYDASDVTKTKKELEANPDLLLSYIVGKKEVKRMDGNAKLTMLKDVIEYIEVKARQGLNEYIRESYNDKSSNLDMLFAVLTQSRLFDVKHSYKKRCHPSISSDILEEIEKNTIDLNDFFEICITEDPINYDYSSDGECYSLSIVYHIAHPEWSLVFGYQTENNEFKHAWLEKEGVVYDPSARVITRSDLYYRYFTLVKKYQLDETILDLQRSKKNCFDYLPNPEHGFEVPSARKISDIEHMISIIKSLADGTYYDKYIKLYYPNKKRNRLTNIVK